MRKESRRKNQQIRKIRANKVNDDDRQVSKLVIGYVSTVTINIVVYLFKKPFLEKTKPFLETFFQWKRTLLRKVSLMLDP